MAENKIPPEKKSEMITADQAARLLGLSKETLNTWRFIGAGPPWYKLGRAIRYKEHEVIAWRESQRNEPTSAEVG